MTPAVDVGDAHAVLALPAAVASLALMCTCSADLWSEATWGVALVGGLTAVALWTSVFGLALRGSAVAKALSAVALGCVGVAMFVGLMAMLLD